LRKADIPGIAPTVSGNGHAEMSALPPIADIRLELVKRAACDPKPPFSFLLNADIDLAVVGFTPHASYS
jgi:hypothetical protein